MAYLVGMVGGDMEILTLLKANIRHKKGSFLSVVLLSLIIAMSFTTILGIKESAFQGVYQSHEIMDTADCLVQYDNAGRLTDEIVDEVRNDDRVDSVEVGDYLIVTKSIMNENEYTNSCMLVKMDEDTKLLKDDISGLRGDAPELKKGEIYVPQGLLSNVDGKVGQKVTMETIAGDFDFTVKGVWLEPLTGAAVIGWKRFCISEADYREIESRIAAKETEGMHGIGKALEIYKKPDCALTTAEFRRELNKDTSVVDRGNSSITRDMSIHYTTLFPQVISSCLLVFIMLLLAIVLIVTVHSISMEIESNYVTFGVLKAQGFGKHKIRLLFLAQYLSAELLGAVLGIVISIPLVGASSNMFAMITAVPAVLSVPFGQIALLLSFLFVLSTVSILLVTIKLNQVSPVRAISGAKKEIYFDSRIKAPISKRLLSASLAFRQFTSAKRRYIGTFVIVAILVFFMMTINVLSNTVNSKSASESMGMMVTEVDFSPKKKLTPQEISGIEKEVARFTEINKKYYSVNGYFSFEGEEIMGQTFEDPGVLPALRGRVPIYENEIAASPILLEEFGLKIGDEVTLGWNGEKKLYLITGTVQLVNDAGRCFVISYDGAKRIGYDQWLLGGYSLASDEKAGEIVDALNEKFPELIEARENQAMMEEAYDVVIFSMQVIIYAFSLLFSLIVVHMVCARAFVQERTDIGIYKAIGFTAGKLRLQFAVRFLTAAVVGSLIGSVCSYAFSGRMLGMLLRGVGLTSFETVFGISAFVVPIAVICLGFFTFAYLAARRIKRVEVRELVQD